MEILLRLLVKNLVVIVSRFLYPEFYFLEGCLLCPVSKMYYCCGV